MMTFAAALLSVTVRAETVTAKSAAFDFDASDSSVLTAPLSISYSPEWIGNAYEPGSSVEIVALAHPGLFNVTTDSVCLAAADVSGSTAYSPTDAATPLRLVMRVVKDGTVLRTLEKDVLIGITYPASQEVNVDTCADSLQRAVSAHPSAIPVAYDLDWFKGAASLRLEVLNRTTGRFGPLTDTTNTLAMLTGPAGDYAWTDSRLDGTTSLRLTPLDGAGQVVGEPLLSSAVFLKLPRGLSVIIR